MNILGLHFGHDAGVCVLREGRIAAYIMRERHRRVKHAVSLEVDNIVSALAAAGVGADQIDFCAITSTQDIELIIDDPKRFSIRMGAHPGHTAPCPLPELIRASGVDASRLLVHTFLGNFFDARNQNSFRFRHYRHFFPEYQGRKASDFAWTGWLDQYGTSSLWVPRRLDQIAGADFSANMNDGMRHGFHYPVVAQLEGREIPAYFICHHMGHAASVFYQSGLSEASIFTHDGHGVGSGYLSGMFFHGSGHKIYPLTPHHLAVGTLYEMVGFSMNLGDYGSEGKLMGLSAYGQPRFFERRFVGNWYDWQERGVGVQAWLEHCVGRGRAMGYDMSALGDRARMTEPINADIAASTQKLFEETFLAAAEVLYKVLERAGKRTDALCLSGGTALNCPSNSRIFREGPFRQIYVEPGCDDSGLAIGAATFLYHNVLEQPVPARTPGVFASAYLGVPVADEQIEAVLNAVGDAVCHRRCEDAAEAAAADLAGDRVIGWFEGRSEIGPRALGHRSILADPRQATNWPRVNVIKGREPWRPFAPAVLQEEAGKWSRGSPLPSPYMLFTATIRSTQVPAVTHADQSARLQTVDESCGEFFRVVRKFFEKTGVPMVLNTSLNGPGQPIVETPQEALAFLCNSTLDALYMGGYRVTRRS